MRKCKFIAFDFIGVNNNVNVVVICNLIYLLGLFLILSATPATVNDLNMIEQTPLHVTEWNYYAPDKPIPENAYITDTVSLDVMKKRAPTKKGIACRFSCVFMLDDVMILQYVAEDSYVIDFEDVIDKRELVSMLTNSFSKFSDTFDLRKLGTILSDRSLTPFDTSNVNLDAILPLLV